MSHLINAASIAYHKTIFPDEITLRPLSSSGDDNALNNKLDFQVYLPIKNNEVALCIEKIKKLNEWDENWDGHNAKRPKGKAIIFAVNLIEDIFDISFALGFSWKAPYVSADSDGDVSLEWWGKSNKQITLYVNENNKIEYIKSATENIHEMEDDILSCFDIDAYQGLFGWLGE